MDPLNNNPPNSNSNQDSPPDLSSGSATVQNDTTQRGAVLEDNNFGSASTPTQSQDLSFGGAGNTPLSNPEPLAQPATSPAEPAFQQPQDLSGVLSLGEQVPNQDSSGQALNWSTPPASPDTSQLPSSSSPSPSDLSATFQQSTTPPSIDTPLSSPGTGFNTGSTFAWPSQVTSDASMGNQGQGNAEPASSLGAGDNPLGVNSQPNPYSQPSADIGLAGTSSAPTGENMLGTSAPSALNLGASPNAADQGGLGSIPSGQEGGVPYQTPPWVSGEQTNTPSWQETGNQSAGGSGLADAAPTDLSHLLETAPAETTVASAPTPTPATETPVAFSSFPETAQAVTGGSGSFPKWLLLVGGLFLILAVAGASAYFILGIGQSKTIAPSSIPAEQQPLTNPPKAIIPTIPPATSGGEQQSFGQLQGQTATKEASPAGSKSGTSAIDLLRQRSQENR